MSARRKQAVGALGFWLTVPAAVSFLIGWLLHTYVSVKLSIVGMAALVYAIFTLIVMTRNQSKVVRGALLLVNLAVFLAFGYYQGIALIPPTWPSWTQWIGVALAAVVWLGVMISIIYGLGKQVESGDNGDDETHTHVTAHTPHGSEPALSASVTEKLIAALKLTSSQGDVTVNTGEIIKELAEWSKRTGIEAAARMSESIMRAVELKLYKPEDLPFVMKVLRKLQGVPEPPEEERSDEDWVDEDPPFRSRSVANSTIGLRRTVTLISTVVWLVTSVAWVVTLYFVAGPRPEYDNTGTFWFMLVIGLFIVYMLMFPKNWAYVPNKYKGVVFRMGQAVQTLHGEGVIHVMWPIESVKRVATFDLRRTRVFRIPVAGETAQDVQVNVLWILYFANPILTLQSVPDKDPELEADEIIEAHVRQAFQGYTLDMVLQPGATKVIDEAISTLVSSDPTLAGWGVTVKRVSLLGVNYPKSVKDASDDILRARGRAAAEKIEGEGRRRAIDLVGENMYTKLEWFQALKESKITTLIGGGFKDLFFDVQEFLQGKGK